MLVTDDSGGKSDGKERDQLQAMIAIGSEFITYKDHESTVQKSGEFVRIEKKSSDPQPRFVLLHETSQTYNLDWQALTGNELLNLAANTKLRKRSRMYVSQIDPQNGDLPFGELSSYSTQTRISRHHGNATVEHPRQYMAVCEANYTAQAGKRRLLPDGAGGMYLVREVVVPGDPRFFNDALAQQDPTTLVTKKRGLRAARVEVSPVDAVTGKPKAPLMSFEPHSGLGFDPWRMWFSNTIRYTSDMYLPPSGSSAGTVYAAFSGVLYGSSLNAPSSTVAPIGGDASDTYAVAEPAFVKEPDGREYVSIVAVYPASDDVYDNRSAGAYRLTCKRTTVTGGFAFSKVTLPSLPPHLVAHYLAVSGMTLHRLSPTKIVLRAKVHFMQHGPTGVTQPSTSLDVFVWSLNNGVTWSYAPGLAWVNDPFPYAGVLCEGENSLLAFSSFVTYGSEQVGVYRVTSSSTTKIASITGAAFSSKLMQAGTWEKQVPYTPIGFGGVVYRKTVTGKKKRLWMQFDPAWVYAKDKTYVLDYPGSRPMLMVSDNNGVTWTRRFLPSAWPFRVGFVVSVGESELAVPVLTQRKEPGAPVKLTVYVSKDGGDSWKPSSAQVSLPGETWTDGWITIGAQYQNKRGEWVYEQNLADAALQFNRGELLPMVALRDADGKALPANPARPWMNDHRIGVPKYAEQT